MPSLEYLIEKSQLTYIADKDSEEWIVFVANPILQKHQKSFDVFLGSEKYDGFELHGSITFKQRSLKNIQWVERCAGYVQEASDGKKFVTEKGYLGTVALIYSQNLSGSAPTFDISILLPADEIFRVQTCLEKFVAYLHIRTPLFSPGLSYGDDPDGRDLKWLADEVEVAIAESISLRFMPAPQESLEPESLNVAEPELCPEQIPVVINAAEFSKGINRLCWVVFLVGLALILKAWV